MLTIAYDSRGNLTSKHHQGSNPITMTVDAANRLVTALDGTSKVTYSYDDNGNMTEEKRNITVQWSYDDEDRMTLENQVNVAPNGKTTHTYAGDGLRRTTKSTTGAVTTFVWDGSDYLQERT